MKSTKVFLRYWFAITSVLSFVAGWIILAHSPKPVQPTSMGTNNLNNLSPSANPAPIQTFGVPNSSTSGGFGNFLNPQNNSQGFSFPSIRTGGS